MGTWIKIALGLALLLGATAAAYAGSVYGWGLRGLLDEPVSVRQHSVSGTSGGPRFHYFGGRRHVGGGHRYGK